MTNKRVLGLTARVGVSIALLVFLLARVPSFDADELLPDWTPWTPFWLVAGLGLTMGGFVLTTLRWQMVLLSLRQRETMPRLYSHYMAGQFVSNFVPTTVGGDVLRVARVSRDIDNGPAGFTSVVFERMSGWIVLPVITYVGFVVNPGLVGLGTATTLPLYIATGTLAALAIAVYVVSHNKIGGWLSGRTGLMRYVHALHDGLDRLRRDRRQALRVLGVAFAYQFVVLLAAAAAAEAMGIDQVGLTALMAFLPAVLVVQMLPIGIGGLGVREAALVLLLGRLGVSDERAIAFGLVLYFLTLACSLIGLPALVFGGRRRAAPVPAHDGQLS